MRNTNNANTITLVQGRSTVFLRWVRVRTKTGTLCHWEWAQWVARTRLAPFHVCFINAILAWQGALAVGTITELLMDVDDVLGNAEVAHKHVLWLAFTLTNQTLNVVRGVWERPVEGRGWNGGRSGGRWEVGGCRSGEVEGGGGHQGAG